VKNENTDSNFSISKISGNASEGSYENTTINNKGKIDKFRHTKLGVTGSITGDFKLELSKKARPSMIVPKTDERFTS